jgi:hypothetical protein
MLCTLLSTRLELLPTLLSLFKNPYVKRFGLLAIISLVAVAMFVVGCSGDGLGAASKPALAPTSAPPSFVRITVTPIPTSTVTPTPTPQVFEINEAPPVFPLELDPEIVEERPEDEVIFEGWTKFLTNTMMVNPNAEDGS